MLEPLHTEVANGPSDIRFIRHFAEAGRAARPYVAGGRCALVCDTATAALFSRDVKAALEAEGLQTALIVIEAGEAAKRFEILEEVCGKLAAAGIRRDDAVFALGGGVVGDLAGLAAAVYLRGVPLIMLPTTLLAQVDSAVGGKTAINLEAGKNLVGAFHQPALVLIAEEALQTLPDRELRSGLGEIIKYAAIADAALFKTLEAIPAGGHTAPEILMPIIRRCCAIKAAYVTEDPLDRGARMALNFGHTVGHAVEAAAGYGMLSHGAAVAIGMVEAAELGTTLRHTRRGTAERLRGLIEVCGLPTAIPRELCGDLLSPLRRDKKMLGGKLHMVFLEAIGKAKIVPTEAEVLIDWLETAGEGG
ncbi:3-dehydroquinate synthase [Oscillospiraceae bacterium OttesenSCG-928-F05]|nr:3-dehydroquinate synthase [Oscillospiraceae bacterium OttesenSCG-928-F05]